MSDLRTWRCDRCGFQMVERHCKVLCPNCGARWDCSDVTIWVGDGSPAFSVRRYRAADQHMLERRWPQAPTAPDLRSAPAWVLLESGELRGYAALFPVPGLPRVFQLCGEVLAQACRQGGAAQLLEALLQSLEPDSVGQITYDVASLEESAARFLQERGFRRGHEEWRMERELPPGTGSQPLPDGYELRTLPYQKAINNFLRLYEESFSPTPWYQPYSRAEVAAELDKAGDLLFLVHGEEPAGFAWLRGQGDAGEIEPMGIIPRHQGRGAGRALLLAALWRLSERGLRRATVGVWRQNEAAVNLYRSAGLQRVARRYFLVYELS